MQPLIANNESCTDCNNLSKEFWRLWRIYQNISVLILHISNLIYFHGCIIKYVFPALPMSLTWIIQRSYRY